MRRRCWLRASGETDSGIVVEVRCEGGGWGLGWVELLRSGVEALANNLTVHGEPGAPRLTDLGRQSQR